MVATQFYLDSIKANNNHLNAFLEVFATDALQQAAALDAGRLANKPPGKLHGVVVALKDVICYKGHRVSASSKILENFTDYKCSVCLILFYNFKIIIPSAMALISLIFH